MCHVTSRLGISSPDELLLYFVYDMIIIIRIGQNMTRSLMLMIYRIHIVRVINSRTCYDSSDRVFSLWVACKWFGTQNVTLHSTKMIYLLLFYRPDLYTVSSVEFNLQMITKLRLVSVNNAVKLHTCWLVVLLNRKLPTGKTDKLDF